jgi:hypothetical protein
LSKIVPRRNRIRSSLVEDHPIPIPVEDLGETVPSSERTAPGSIGSGPAEDQYKGNPPFLLRALRTRRRRAK